MTVKRAPRLWRILVLALLAAFGLAPGAAPQGEGPSRLAVVVAVEGVIGPATVRHVENALEQAHTRGAAVVVLRLNTPGGLVDATRELITSILASDVPVVGYVAPSGAHAASAGTYLLYATHVAAMAPGTNIGAATPIALGGTPSPAEPPAAPGGEGKGAARETNADQLDLKGVNDAVAFLKSLAELRGRNAEWAEKAVREAATLTASEALAANVIEVVAPTIPDLLVAVDGRTVNMGTRTQRLATAGAAIEEVEPSFFTQVLILLANPNIAFLLMMIGVYGLILEFYNPGYIAPGVLGAIALILGLYALNQLPLDFAGLVLILFGIGFMVAEAFTPTFGVLGIGGVAAFIIGSAMLIDTDIPEFQLSWTVILGTAALSVGVFVLLIGFIWKARRRPIASGAERLVGTEAEVLEWAKGGGFVWSHGERWQARGPGAVRPGEKVVIKRLDGLTLVVASETKKQGKSKG
jgi:membrane-bound serine protease (ClpP class)